MSAVALLIFALAAIAAIPIAHALVLAAIGGILTSDRVPLGLVVEQMVSQVQSFPLIAIPFFILTGALMMGGRLGKTLIELLTTLIGRFHGGPAQVGVLSSTIHSYPTQAEVLRKIGDGYMRTKLTPTVKKIFAKWLEWRR